MRGSLFYFMMLAMVLVAVLTIRAINAHEREEGFRTLTERLVPEIRGQ
jgi:hypothetical protein